MLSRRQALLWLGGVALGGVIAGVALGYILGLRSGIRGVNWFTICILAVRLCTAARPIPSECRAPPLQAAETGFVQLVEELAERKLR